MADIKKALKKFWHFIWHEDSVLSWIVNIILAFIIIKFLIYPGIGWALGTNLPVVAVISESMEHNAPLNQWWASPALCGEGNLFYSNYSDCTQQEWYNEMHITYQQFEKFPMKNGFNKGDIIILTGEKFDDLKIGEIIVYQSRLAYPIIHRVVAKDDVVQTKGDHNARQITDAQLNEKYITKDQIIGKAWLKIPYLGYIKIWFSGIVNCLFTGFKTCSF
jgi:signal peptidase I